MLQSIIIEERDARRTKLQYAGLNLATTARTATQTPTARLHNSGAVALSHFDYKTWNTQSFAANRHYSNGGLIQQPDIFGKPVAYRVKGLATVEGSTILPICFVGASGANSVTTGAAGQPVQSPTSLSLPIMTGNSFSSAAVDDIIILEEISDQNNVDLSGRPLLFGWVFHNLSSQTQSNKVVIANLSVQCLAVQPETYIDRRKQ